jgi:NAD(P)-dependent dehydrogenase (short-subunit alcohol dehydrogenase family)
MPLLADVASSEEMSRGIDDLVDAYGRLDIVVANAGINGVWAPVGELAPEEWDRTIATDLRGTFLTLHYAIPWLKRAGRGSVVMISSINGTRTFTGAGATAYACSKEAQLALGQMAAVELSKHGIRVNVVCPGAIHTEIGDNTQTRNTEAGKVPADYPAGEIPLTGKRPDRAEDGAELVLFLASDQSRHISGSPVWIDGAQSLLM